MTRRLSGEADLRALVRRFRGGERRIRALLARAPEGDRRQLLTEALEILIALRREDFRAPVIAAYLAAFRTVRAGGAPQDASDLAGSLAKKLDRGARTASKNAREAFRTVFSENVEEMAAAAVVAHVDQRGNRWSLSSLGDDEHGDDRQAGELARSLGRRW